MKVGYPFSGCAAFCCAAFCANAGPATAIAPAVTSNAVRLISGLICDSRFIEVIFLPKEYTPFIINYFLWLTPLVLEVQTPEHNLPTVIVQSANRLTTSNRCRAGETVQII